MARQRVFSGSSFEDLAGYARAVVDGPWVFVSGTTGYDYTNMTISEDAAAQTEACFRNIRTALEEAGAALADMVRIRIFVVDRADFSAVAEVVGRYCRDIRPANTTVVCQLIDPAMKVEIEVTALRSAS